MRFEKSWAKEHANDGKQKGGRPFMSHGSFRAPTSEKRNRIDVEASRERAHFDRSPKNRSSLEPAALTSSTLRAGPAA
jgi:hypothetical protein